MSDEFKWAQITTHKDSERAMCAIGELRVFRLDLAIEVDSTKPYGWRVFTKDRRYIKGESLNMPMAKACAEAIARIEMDFGKT